MSSLDFIKQPLFTAVIASKRNSGKSNLAKYIVMELAKKRFFDIAVVMSGTLYNRGYDYIPEQYRFEGFREDILQDLINSQKEKIEKGKEKVPVILLLLDDVVGENIQRSNVLSALFTYSRHLKISILVLSQVVKRTLTITVRNNIDYLFYSSLTYDCMKAIYELVITQSRFTEWKKQMTSAIDSDAFVYIAYDNLTQDANRRYIKIKAPAPQQMNFQLRY